MKKHGVSPTTCFAATGKSFFLTGEFEQ